MEPCHARDAEDYPAVRRRGCRLRNRTRPITVRVCLDYSTVFHPPIFAIQSPTLLAPGWGIIATWWVGLFLGLLLALAARVGPRQHLSTSELLRPIFLFLVVMACCASLAGVAGFFAACSGLIGGRQVLVPSLGQSAYPRFVADWFAHTASYAIGFLGGLVLCVLQYRRRRVLARIETMSGPAVKTLARRN